MELVYIALGTLSPSPLCLCLQVLPVQNELSRYAGETTGIRSHLARSVKIK